MCSLWKARRLNISIKYDWVEIQTYYDKTTKEETFKKFGFSNWSWLHKVKTGVLKVKEVDLNKSSKFKPKPIESYLVNPSKMDGTHLKKRLIKEGYLVNVCSLCGLKDWMNKTINLHLDHINGDSLDNRINNLRLLCPNCHSQTDTYCGRNKRYKS